jgi:class 3 adenylate cyclase
LLGAEHIGRSERVVALIPQARPSSTSSGTVSASIESDTPRASEGLLVTTEQDVAQVRSVVYLMAGAFAAKDVDGAMGTFIEEGASIVGTGLDELRFGSDAVRFQIARDISEADTLSFGMESLRVDVFGDAAFAFADAVINATFGSESFRFPVRSTFGLVRTDAGWRIAQVHTSVAHHQQSQGRSYPVKLTKTLSDLLSSIDGAAGSSVLQSKSLGTATFVFTDIVDSTALSQSIGDQKWSELIGNHFKTVEEIVENGGGSVVKTLGDGGMFAFPSGTAALLAAIQTQHAVTSSTEHRLSLRVGVHTGDVVQEQNDYIGLTVNKAARVAAAAEGDQILVSSTTADIVNHSEIEFGDPITVELKGITGTHTLLPLNWQT